MHSPGKIRVGVIGLSVDPYQWGAAAHLPALRSLPEYEVAAVATTRQETAEASAAMYQIPLAFGDYRQMVARPDIDMVCVATSVLHHHQLTMAALEAGKHVFCEWPLGLNTAQAVEMRDLAQAKGVRTVVGLQTRCAPMVRYVRDLIAEGYVGQVTSVDLARAGNHNAGPTLARSKLYLRDRTQGNAGLNILCGHTLDTLAAYVGEFTDLQAYAEVLRPDVKVAETGEPFRITAPDHILVQGRLAGGAVVSAQFKMNSPNSKTLHLEILGSRGVLIVSSEGTLGPHDRPPGVPSELELSGTSDHSRRPERLEVPARYRLTPSDTPRGQPFDMAHLYKGFSEELLTGKPFGMGFEHGVMRHRLLDTIQAAADAGQRRAWAA